MTRRMPAAVLTRCTNYCIRVPSTSTSRPRHRTRFQAATIRVLERLAQGTSQLARNHESWAHIAHVVDETKPDKAAALADAVVSEVGAERADKLGSCQ